MSTSLLINTFINDELKFNHFKKNFIEIYELFDDIHVKIRGDFEDNCLNLVKKICKDYNLFIYQSLEGADWVADTLKIIEKITSKAIFIFNEDHFINTNKDLFIQTIQDFNKYNIDYMPYSFFKASKLNTCNILPLNPIQKKNFNFFEIDKKKLKLIGQISPTYYYISLSGIFSKRYLHYHLIKNNFKHKFHTLFLSKIISRIFNEKRRYIYEIINNLINKFSINLCLYPFYTPFNLEKMWFENYNFKRSWRYAILKNELFTNFDDDNGFYGESLIKRGLYPFEDNYFIKDLKNKKNLLSKFDLILYKGDKYDATYYSRLNRINKCPVLGIEVIEGIISVKNDRENIQIKSNNILLTYSNQSPILIALSDCKLEISVFDEISTR